MVLYLGERKSIRKLCRQAHCLLVAMGGLCFYVFGSDSFHCYGCNVGAASACRISAGVSKEVFGPGAEKEILMRQMLYVLAGVLGWAAVFFGCTPTLTEVIKQSNSRAELQKNVNAHCDALFPTKPGSDTDSGKHYQCTKELQRKFCRYRGGRWHQFTSGCTNRCSYEIARQSGQRMTCTMNMPQECLCPSGQCWTGSHCKPLPTEKIKANLRRRQKHNDLVKMYRDGRQVW